MLTHCSASAGTHPRAATPPHALKFLPFDSAGNAADGSFSGYASLFDTPDMSNDIIAPGAFTDSLARRGTRGVKLLFHHDAAQPIGVWQTLREDSRGLFVEGQLSLDNSKARDILALLRSGAIDGLSIGFKAIRTRRDRPNAARKIEKIDLWEISIVTFPMMPEARVAAVKKRASTHRTSSTPDIGAKLRDLAATIRSATPNHRI